MSESYAALRRFQELLIQHGASNWFNLDGVPCMFDDWVDGEDWARVKLVNRYGHRFEIDAPDLAGHYFNEWRL